MESSNSARLCPVRQIVCSSLDFEPINKYKEMNCKANSPANNQGRSSILQQHIQYIIYVDLPINRSIIVRVGIKSRSIPKTNVKSRNKTIRPSFHSEPKT